MRQLTVLPVSKESLLQSKVPSTHVHQFGVRAFLNDTAVLHVTDLVSVFDGRQSVRDDE